MRAEIKEMQQLIASDDRQLMLDYLATHRPESRDEMEMYCKLRNKEYSLRKTSTVETEKTRKLLNSSRRNKGNG